MSTGDGTTSGGGRGGQVGRPLTDEVARGVWVTAIRLGELAEILTPWTSPMNASETAGTALGVTVVSVEMGANGRG